jgi:hypothetical protein
LANHKDKGEQDLCHQPARVPKELGKDVPTIGPMFAQFGASGSRKNTKFCIFRSFFEFRAAGLVVNRKKIAH